MKKGKRSSLGRGIALLGVSFVLLALALNLAAATTTAKGKLNTVDPGQRKVSLKTDSGGVLYLKAPSAAVIIRNGSRVALNKLTLRDTATIKYDPATGNVANLNASGPRVSQSNGTVKGVRDTAGTVKVGLKNFKTFATSKLVRNGRVVPLGRLTRHDTVAVHARPGTVQVNDILGCGPEESEMEGTILAIDPVAGTITVATDNETPAMTFTTDAATIIELDDAAVALSALTVELEVEVIYNPETLLAYRIEAETECDEAEIEGTVSAIDLGAGTITITPYGGEEVVQCYPVTLTVTADTEIIVNGVGAVLADIQVGMEASAVYSEATLIAKRIEAGTEDGEEEDEESVEGTVLELGENTITIGYASEANLVGCEEPVTLTVDGSTLITINGEAGLFTGILVGDWAWATYDEETLLATEIHVESCSAAANATTLTRKK